MKTLLIVSKIVMLTLLMLEASKTFASHSVGADISYECLDPVTRTYLVTVKFYRDCDGINAPGSMSITPTSSCGNGTAFTLNKIPGTPTVIDPTCGGTSSCSGGPDKGIEEYVYQGITILPFVCSDWIFAWSTCCRNAAIDNLNGPSSQSSYFAAMLNSIDAPCNTAPVFSNLPVPFACNGQSYTFNNGAYEPDGDSLVYSLVSPMQSVSTPVSFLGPYTATAPLPVSIPFTVDPVTGDITFTPNAPSTPFDGVFALLIEEYRNGVLIGSVVRDMQITILTCSNTLPVLTGVDSTSVYNITVTACQTSCFNIYANDPDANNLTLTASYLGIAGAVFTVAGQGTPNPVATFCLSPDDGNVTGASPILLTVTVADDACPIIGQQTFSYAIYVNPGPSPPTITASQSSICAGECVTLTAVGDSVDTVLWNTGETTTVINVCPATTTTYTLESATGTCIRHEFYTINVNPTPTASITPDEPVLCNGSSVTLTASGGTGYLWSTTETTTSIIVSPGSTTTYSVEVTNTFGCKDTAYALVTMNPPPAAAICNIVWVIPGSGPFGNGTRTNPADLLTGLYLAQCNNSTIKMRQGTYNISQSISITNTTTIEGGYDPTNWDIKSNAAPTIIYRDNTNPETPPLRITAFELNTVSNFRMQDLTIQVQDAPAGTGMSVYGIHMINCSDYDIVRCNVIAGDAGTGADGVGGVDGANGSLGINGQGGSPDGSCCRAGGAGGFSPAGNPGGAGGTGGDGGSNSCNNGTSGQGLHKNEKAGKLPGLKSWW
ncbi:MAG: hypothetical protein FVQ77_06205 [Cytophagales bacterium]|nr:hypothetical protein [Cytophagales bacterium]